MLFKLLGTKFLRQHTSCLVPDSSFKVHFQVKMVTKLHVEGFDALMTEVDNHSDKDLYVLFCGSRDQEGKSWCPDCVVGE